MYICKKTLFTLLLLVSLTHSAWAAKAMRGAFDVVLSDGTSLTVSGHGDEHLAWYLTTDGVLLYHEGYDYYYAVVDERGGISNSGVLAHNPGERDAREEALADKTALKRMLSAHETQKMQKETVAPVSSSIFPHMGTPKVLVILADFTDQRFTYDDETMVKIFNQYLNAEGTPAVGNEKIDKDQWFSRNYGSVKTYFTDMSYGMFSPDFRIGAVVHLDHNLQYYGAGQSDNMSRFIPDVCKAADAEVNFADYDENGDGYVDLVYVIYAGYAESMTGNSTDCLWPKSGAFNAGTFDGKTVYRYGINNELNGSPENGVIINGIGLFCHEFSHTMGLPDLYSVQSTNGNVSNNTGMEDFSLMDNGEYVYSGYRPTAYTAWERKLMGWLKIDELTEAGTYSMTSLMDKDKAKAYCIRNTQNGAKNEYYILENIQKEGWNYRLGWQRRDKDNKSDQDVHGMMITHVEYAEDDIVPLATINRTQQGHPKMTLLPANGTLVSSYASNEWYKDMDAMLFPGANNVTEFKYQLEGYTRPIVYNGTAEYMAEHHPVLNISEANGIVSFTYINEGPATINHIMTNDDTPRIHTLSGIYVGNDINTLPRGIYVKGGRKVVIR